MHPALRAIDTFRSEGLREVLVRVRGVTRDRTVPHLPAPRTTLGWYLRVRAALTAEAYCPGDPFALRSVDPNRIDLVSEHSRLLTDEERLHWGKVEDGDWDRTDVRFDDQPVPASIRLHYREGVPWSETPLRDHFASVTEYPTPAWGYTDPDEFEARTRDVETLYERIREGGYRSKRSLIDDGDVGASDPIPPVLDDVTVDVGREGRLYYRCWGQHRLAIARVLDLDSIPVLVGSVHEAAVESGDWPPDS